MKWQRMGFFATDRENKKPQKHRARNPKTDWERDGFENQKNTKNTTQPNPPTPLGSGATPLGTEVM